jgi:hypothetical protein
MGIRMNNRGVSLLKVQYIHIQKNKKDKRKLSMKRMSVINSRKRRKEGLSIFHL